MTDYIQVQAAEWDAYTQRYLDHESVSGPGSTREFTKPLRAWLPIRLRYYAIGSILDAACGDWAWMQYVDLAGIDYTGWDVNRDIINVNRDRFGWVNFETVNLLTVQDIPKVDLIIARDILIHLPDEHVINIIDKFRASGSTYLLTTNFPDDTNDVADPHDRDGFYYRPINLGAPPFNLTGRIAAVAEPGREPGREMLLCAL